MLSILSRKLRSVDLSRCCRPSLVGQCSPVGVITSAITPACSPAARRGCSRTWLWDSARLPLPRTARQVVQQQIEFRLKQIFPSFVNARTTLAYVPTLDPASVQPVFFRYRKILPQQDVHRALIEPLPVHPKLATWIDQPITTSSSSLYQATLSVPSAISPPRTDPVQLRHSSHPNQHCRMLARAPASSAELHLHAVDGVGGYRRPLE